MKISFKASDFDSKALYKYVGVVDGDGLGNNNIAVFEPIERDLKYYGTLKDFEDFQFKPISAEDFKSLYLICENVDATFIPNSVFEEGMLQVYEAYLTGDGIAKAQVTELNGLDLKTLEIHDVSRFSKALLSLKKVMVKSDLSILLEGIGLYLQEDENSTAGLHFLKDRVIFYFFKNGEFMFCNTYALMRDLQLEKILGDASQYFEGGFAQIRMLLSGDINQFGDQRLKIVQNKFKQCQIVDLAEITGDALVPGELIEQQHRLLLPYFLIHNSFILDN